MTEYRKHESQASDYHLRSFIFEKIDLKDKLKLNVGCGNDYIDEPGWVNLDGDPKVKCDICVDLDSYFLSEDKFFSKEQFDIIYASHIFEHIHNLVQLKKQLTYLLKPSGLLIVMVPDYLSPDAWGDDTHCRAFSKESFLLSFWPGFKNGRIQELDIDKQMGKCKWLLAYMEKCDEQ